MTMLSPNEITKLTPLERLTLIGALWDSLADRDVPVMPSQTRELTRRLESFEADRPQAVTWTELKAELAARTV